MKKTNSLLRGLTYLLCCLSISTFAQTYVGPGGDEDAITSGNCSTTNYEIPLDVVDVSIGNALKEVSINISHTWVGDLVITLIAPNGTETQLVNRRGSGGDDFENTVFRDDATLLISSITSSSAPFTNTYRPEEPLSNFTGQTNGIWKLRVCDFVGGDDGTLNSWSLTFEPQVQANIDPGCVTYYPGYYCPDISVEAFSGTPPYTYLWSDGSETATITACPAETSVYSVTVTDASGDTATAEVTVVVTESVACQNGKVMVCHTKGNGSTSTLCISQDSVQDHLDHGDTIGSCELDYYSCDSLPSCPTITAPSNNAANVSIPVTIEWTAASGLVDGYYVSVGTQMGLTDVIDNADAGLDLEYTLDNLDYLTSYYVTVTAYNDNGESENCQGITFKTQKSPCDLATTVFCNAGPYPGTTVGGTLESDLGTCGTSLDTSPGVWYKFTGTGDIVTVDTQGSVLDTKLGVFTGNCGNLSCLDGNDDGFGSFGPSKVSFSSTSGTTYYIFVTGYSTNQGEYVLNVSCATPIANDDCNGALSVRVNEIGSECQVTFPADHTNASDSGTEFSCDTSGNIDSWYTFIGPTSGVVELSTTNGTQTGTPGWAIYDECSGNIVFCDDNTSDTTVLVTPETSYILAVWYDSFSTQGTFTICLNEGMPPVENDECSGAIEVPVSENLTCNAPVVGSTDNSTQSLSGCTGYADDDVWYKFVATGSEHIIFINNTGGSSDIVTQVFDACNGNSILCQDYPNSPVEVTGLTANQTYYFRIYTWFSGSTSDFEVCVGTPPPPPPNNSCSDPIILTVNAVGSECNTTYEADYTYATASGGPFSCDPPTTTNTDLWFTFVAPTSGIVDLDVTDITQSGTPEYALFDACGGEELFCSEGNFARFDGLSTGTSYTLAIWYDGSGNGTADICLNEYVPAGPTVITCGVAYNETYCYTAFDISTFAYTNSGNGPLTIEFNAGFIESSTFDDLRIYEGTDSTGTLLWENGSSTISNLDGIYATSATGNLFMTITSDDSVQCEGSSSTRTWDFDVYCGDPAPTNNDCSGAISLTVNASGSECAVVYNADHTYATASDTSFSCDSSGNIDTWYTFVAPTSGQVEIEVTELTQSGSFEYALFDGCGSTATELLCNDGSRLDGLTAGNTYTLAIWFEDFNTEGTFDICLNEYVPAGPTVITCGVAYNETYCYIANDNNSFSYTNNGNGPLTIEFNAGYIENDTWDDLKIYDGTDATGTLLWENGSTTITNLDGTYATSATGNLFMTITSDNTSQCEGTSSSTRTWDFDVYCGEYVPVFEGTTVDCATAGYNEEFCYVNNEIREWSFGSSDGSSPLTITFNSGYLEPNGNNTWDDILIYDGLGATGTLLYTSDDGVSGSDLTGLSFTASSGYMYILFDSDSSVNCSSNTYDPINFDVYCGSSVDRMTNTNQSSTIDWSMAPNPTKGNVTLDLTNYLQSNVSIEVVDFTGKVISTAKVKEVQSARYTLELRNSLPAGMYFVRVASGAQVSTKKLMIMR